MPRLREFLDAFLVPWSVAAGIALGSGALLLLRWLGIADLQALPLLVFGIAWILFCYAGVVLFIRIVQAAGTLAKRMHDKRQRRNWINQNLDSLGAEERHVLSYMLEHNQRSLAGRLAYGGFGPLVQKGLPVRGAGQFNMMEWPHTVPDDVWVELVRRRDEFVDGN